MEKTYESWMSCDIVTSDGEYTIGYVNGQAADWDGAATPLEAGQSFYVKQDGATFGINCQDEWWVEDGQWTTA